MFNVECPRPAYDRLVNKGLDVRVMDAKDEIWEIAGSTIYLGDIKKLVNEAKKYFSQAGRDSERTALYRDILELEAEIAEDPWEDKDELLMRHPSVLGFVALGEDVLRFREFGFETRRQLEESITSYCAGEEWKISGWHDRHIWRNDDYKNEMTNTFHGDCWFHQTDISGRDAIKQTLFGPVLVFDTWKDCSELGTGIAAGYNYWPAYLTITLKYAEALGMRDISDIRNWRNVLESVGGGVGTATTEAMLGEASDFGLRQVLESPVLNTDEKQRLKTWPLTITSDREQTYYPCVSGRKLLYLRQDEQGEFDLSFAAPRFEGKRFSPHVIYDEKDLPQLLRGIYRLFARDRSQLPKIMDSFISRSFVF